MGPSGHFYSHVDPVWSLYSVGTGCILGKAHSTYKGDSARFSLNPESWKKGTQLILLMYVSHDMRYKYSTG